MSPSIGILLNGVLIPKLLNNRLKIEKCFLILILANRLKKCYSQEKRKLKFIQP